MRLAKIMSQETPNGYRPDAREAGEVDSDLSDREERVCPFHSNS